LVVEERLEQVVQVLVGRHLVLLTVVVVKDQIQYFQLLHQLVVVLVVEVLRQILDKIQVVLEVQEAVLPLLTLEVVTHQLDQVEQVTLHQLAHLKVIMVVLLMVTDTHTQRQLIEDRRVVVEVLRLLLRLRLPLLQRVEQEQQHILQVHQ